MTRQVFTAVRLPKFMFLDPVSRSIVTAPADIEPLTLEEGQALDRAEVWPRKNGG